ncbi:MAG: 23S rRNA (uracil(1939)-C(5))-methyltransferase RlmD [Clostridia bacterium]|nr:23S rRNA (uracil(1939)-C(5))-methyltransferase RlmD [Clostridia bacterium]
MKKIVLTATSRCNIMEKNEIIVLTITAMSSEGSGIGRYDGMAVFVPMTAVGDTAEVLILKVKSNCAYGKLLRLITPSPDREENNCDVFSKCGGCVYRHISYSAECQIKQKKVEDAVYRIGGVYMPPQPICAPSKSERYRNKAQYPINEEGLCGFYAGHSHRIIPCEDCLLQPKEFAKISECFSASLRKRGLSIYNEQTGKGLIRHLYIRKAEATGQIMVCIVVNGDSLPFSEELVDSLKEILKDSLKTVVLNINKEKTNVILGKRLVAIFGDGYIYDELCGIKVRLSPLSFYQVNRSMAEKLYKKAAEYAEADGKTVLDLYCGAGAIGLSMAKKAKQIIGVEIIPDAVRDAEYNAELNQIKNARFICNDAANAASKLKEEGIKPDTVVLDPPRKGCSKELLITVAKDFCPERLVYVSCDPATLARDIKILSELGYELKEYTPFDLFPRTSHVETAALFLHDINS